VTSYNASSHIPHGEETVQTLLAPSQWMVALINCNNNFAILATLSQAMKHNNYIGLNTILHYIHLLYIAYFYFISAHWEQG
jgi:hypothetical protein